MPKHPKKDGSTLRTSSEADEILPTLQKSICRLVLLYVTLPHILKDTTAEQSLLTRHYEALLSFQNIR